MSFHTFKPHVDLNKDKRKTVYPIFFLRESISGERHTLSLNFVDISNRYWEKMLFLFCKMKSGI